MRGYGNVGNGCIFARCHPGARAVLMSLVVVVLSMCSPVEFIVSTKVTGVRSQYCALFNLLGLWSGFIGFVTEYYTSSTCILWVKSLKPRSCLQPQVSSAALLRDFMSTITPVVSLCPGAPGYKINNMLSGLKHLRTHECVGQPHVNVVDWTAMAAVTPVKNREQYDSCWACATTSSFEGDGFIVTGNMSPLSEQQPVNCDTVVSGCNGCLLSRQRD